MMIKYTLLLIFLLFSNNAYSTTKWALDNPLSGWFQNLHSPRGYLCCGEQDGIKDPPYKENDDGSYEVFYDNSWHHADKEDIVQATNQIGYAIVWPERYRRNIRCFLPGSRG